MPNNVAASMTASVVIDKKDIIAQVLSGISVAQKEIDNNKLEIFFDISDENVTKQLKEFQKKLRGKDFIIKLEAQGIEETFNNIESFLKRIDKINLNKTLGIGNGKGIGNSIVDEKSLQTVIDLFAKMESHLGDMKKVFADVGDGEEFSPLLKMINSVSDSIDKLNGSVKNIGLNMNIDFGSDNQMESKINEKASKYLFSYKNLFEKLKLSGIPDATIVDSLFDFEKTIEQYDTTIGKIAAFEKELDKLVKFSNDKYGKNILKTDWNKGAWNSLSSSKGQYTKAVNELKRSTDSSDTELSNLFGSNTDLTEVITQLGLIITKLEEISSTALDFKNTFSDGFNVKTSVEEIETLTKKVKELEEELAKVKVSSDVSIKDTFQGDVKVSESDTSLGKEADEIKEIAKVTPKATKAKNEFADANERVDKGAKKSSESISKEASEFNKVINKLDGYQKKFDKFSVKPTDGHRYPLYEDNINSLKKKIKELKALSQKDINLINEKDINDAKELQKGIDELIFKMNNMSAGEKGFDPLSADKALEKINSELKKNSAMSNEAKAKIKALYREIASGNPSKPIKDLLHEMYELIQAERLAGREGKSFMDIFKEKVVYGFAGQLATSFGIYDIINVLREGVTVVRELDTALTEMRKVSDETVSSLERFQDVSFDLADTVGTTAKQIQNSTADFLRIGEALNEASESAETANILKNVSEFESIDEATESLVAMSQAYKDLEKIEIVDVLNHIGNEYSISTDGIATALQNSASALVTANNDLNEATALITAGNAVTQDPSKVGAGMRTIALRLVGTQEAKEQLKELGEEVDDMIMTSSKVRETIMNATKAAFGGKGFDILDENGNYKSTYEIMQGLADLYDEIVAKDKELGTNNLNLLLETIAGKNRANIAASILQNGDMLRSVYEDAQMSDGSAQEELDKYLESIDGRMAKLENQAQEFWYKLIDSDTIKNGITLLTDLLGLLTDIVDVFGVGGLATIGAAGFGIHEFVKNFAWLAKGDNNFRLSYSF